METVDAPVHTSEVDSRSVLKSSDDISTSTSMEEIQNIKSNGQVESADAAQVVNSALDECESTVNVVVDKDIQLPENKFDSTIVSEEQIIHDISENQFSTSIETEVVENTVIESESVYGGSSIITEELTEEVVEVTLINSKEYVQTEEPSVVHINSESPHDVTFKTEILIEKHENEMQDVDISINKSDSHESTNNILSELGHSIELSAVLNSDIVEHNENNNGTVRQEVFNKEELLDILEGNVKEMSETEVTQNSEAHQEDIKSIEAQLALQQLSRLAKGKRGANRSNKSIERHPRKRSKKKSECNNSLKDKKIISEEIRKECNIDIKMEENSEGHLEHEVDNNSKECSKDNIVNVLVKDWDDVETPEDESKKILEESDNLLAETEVIVIAQENINNTGQPAEQLLEDSVVGEVNEIQNQNTNKSNDECQPQRRLGRVIKKKVIFDPDNPDTFTKGKTAVKNKELQSDKEQPPPKKGKNDHAPLRSQSKSPTSKLHWKKPTPKNSKQNKRLTEIDKLLMDEGAVNMIYQLTPEAPKGKKNMRTKAEFIKKIQSSTPDSKEMKFRERKKENKNDEGEAKKIVSGKHRTSLSSSVKSMSVCEDFETHSADDSIIYRRHSSSSYSSSCMSPRRLSDVDTSSIQAVSVTQQTSEKHNQNKVQMDKQAADVFMPDDTNISGADVINKNDCLSIKKKLNSKLSSVLNKRKHENKSETKSLKHRKVMQDAVKNENVDNLKFLSINFDHNLAEICIRKTSSKYSIETLKELQKALGYVDSRKDISVTLLMSECGTLCSDLDLNPVLDDNIERRTNHAFEIAEGARSLLCAIEQHSKLLCCGIWKSCWGIALPMLALSDVVISSECATFALKASRSGPPLPGLAVFTAHLRPISHQLVNDLVVFGRQISASEALHCGLVNRVLWPERFVDQFRAVVKDIAAQPPQGILLKKQLLSLKKSGDSESTFLSCLEAERDLLAEYWISVEGQESLRATLGAP